MQLIGKTVGKYRITKRIGRGGMADVFKAYQADLDRYVAIKILAPQHAHTPGFRERFFREAKSIARLSHANILPIHEIGMEDDLSYIAMKFVAGSTMREIMGEQMFLPAACNFIDQIAGALDHAHENAIVHRDIKPANLLLDKNWVFLTDFGIAKIMEASTVLTSTGEVMGTPAYMSPEQASGDPVDHRTDIYSLGIVLYEMITGRVPFTGETPYGVMFRHVQGELPLPSSFRPGLSEEVECVILKALAKVPEHRYESAGRLAEALREAVLADRGERTTRVISGGASNKPSRGFLPKEEEETVPTSEPVIDLDDGIRSPKETAARPKRSFRLPLAFMVLAAIGIAALLYTRSAAPPPVTVTKPESEATMRSLPKETQAKPPVLSPALETASTPKVTEPKEESPRPEKTEEDAGSLYQRAIQSIDQKNYNDALQYFHRAGEKGHIESLHEVGYMYRQGLGVKKNDAEAAKWYRRAADQGFAASQNNLGVMYLKGEGVEKSEREAFKWFMKAAGQGNPGAQFHVATMYRNGIGVQADEAKALEWYKRAADLGHRQAGEMYEKALSAKSDEDAGTLHTKATQYLEQKNYGEALKYFHRAVEKGKAESMNELGYMYRQGLGVKKNDTEAAKWYRKAADQGSGAAWNNLGVMYLKGEGVEKSEQEAFKCFEEAAAQGSVGAQFHLGIMYHKGIGIRSDETKAVEWYRKAADQGHEQARAALKIFGERN